MRDDHSTNRTAGETEIVRNPPVWPLVRRAGALLVAFAMLSAGAAQAQGIEYAAKAEGPAFTFVRAGQVVDVLAGKVLTDQMITIDDGGRIVSVAPFTKPPKADAFIDWSEYQVLPGLMDMHTHIGDEAQSENIAAPLLTSEADMALLGAQQARDTLRAGFTTVRNVGNWRALIDTDIRDAINAGEIEGPRMSVAGAYITIPGGGGEVTGLAPDVTIPPVMRMGVVTGPEDTRQKVRYLLQHGVDFIKLIATGAVLTVGTEPGQLELTPEEMKAAVDEAAHFNTYATAHAHGADGIKAAIRAGVRSIEHASLIDDEGIALAKAKGVYLVMDIYNGDFIDEMGKKEGWPAETLRKNFETTEAQRIGFRKAVKAGAKIAYGTDAGVFPHGENAKQFRYMVKYGMSPMQAIQAATVVPSELLGWQKDVGAIAPGRYADLVAIKGDALKDITLLEHVQAVMKGGVVVK